VDWRVVMTFYQHRMVFFSMKTGVLNLSYQNALEVTEHCNIFDKSRFFK